MRDNPIPQRIHRDDHEVVITWDEHHQGSFPARDLRLRCHCATCRDEMSGGPLLDPAMVPQDIRPVAISLVGSYAIKIDWSDGHGTGIYTYEYLRSFCPCEVCAAGRSATE